MMTMIEKMARAMYEARPGEFTGEAVVSWDAEYPDTKETLRVLARAALTAMLEPNGHMVTAAALAAMMREDDQHIYADSYRAMIQAALDEK